MSEKHKDIFPDEQIEKARKIKPEALIGRFGWNPGDIAFEDSAPQNPKGVTMAQLRAPAGTDTIIGGKPFKPGQFIPNADLEKASPEEKAELKKKLEQLTPKPPAEKPKPSIKSPSKAKVSVAGDPAEVSEELDKLLPTSNFQSMASLAGATDDAKVTIKQTAASVTGVDLIAETKDYTAYRSLRLDPETGKTIMRNDGFEIDPAAQGKGIGTQVFAKQVEHASKMGVSKITTVAAGDVNDPRYNGYSTWPKMGYDGPIPDSTKAKLPAQFQSATKVSDLMKTPEGRELWKQHGKTTRMEFDMTEGSYSRRTLEKYLEKKGVS